jgi:hypothetical protein
VTTNLATTQRLVWKLISAPEGVAAGLARLDPDERAHAEGLVVSDQRLSAAERLDIYANMYFYRLRDALKDDFSAVCAVVGEAHFHNLVTDYLLVHPPSHFSLRYAGKHLASFLASHASLARWPFVADLARLEWAILDAFDAPDAPVLVPEALGSVAPERWPTMRFRLTPSLCLLDVGWPVHAVWTQTQRQVPPADPPPVRTLLRVWRQNLRVYHCAITEAEHSALTAITRGATLAEVCDHIVACSGENAGTEQAAALLREWLIDGLLTRFDFAS